MDERYTCPITKFGHLEKSLLLSVTEISTIYVVNHEYQFILK
jgi:hypothetical protein